MDPNLITIFSGAVVGFILAKTFAASATGYGEKILLVLTAVIVWKFFALGVKGLEQMVQTHMWDLFSSSDRFIFGLVVGGLVGTTTKRARPIQ